MPSLRPSCCCRELTALISLAWVKLSGPTQAPKYAPVAGGVGACDGLTVVLTSGAGWTASDGAAVAAADGDEAADGENGLMMTMAATAATISTAMPPNRRFRRLATSSDPVSMGVEVAPHALTR